MSAETRVRVKPASPPPSVMSVPKGLLQRKCACGGPPGAGGECADCQKKKLDLQRKESGRRAPGIAPPIVHEVLSSPGRPMDPEVRFFMESRIGHDFGQVRVHTDARAAESAGVVGALAYTVGRNIVFRAGQYAPRSTPGRWLLAHELTHVRQQGNRAHGVTPMARIELGDPGDWDETEADRAAAQAVSGGTTSRSAGAEVSSFLTLRRVNTAETAEVLRQGTVAGSGLQFYPTAVASTRVGPVSGEGGLLGDSGVRLSVIVGTNLTLNELARKLLPLWQTATPFIPSGATAPAPLAPLTEARLARGLLVYNRYFLALPPPPAPPAIPRWKAGLRFPLPIEIDPATNEGVLQPLLIQSLAGAFDATWDPLLSQPALAPTAPAPTDLQAAVTAFLASAPTTLARGTALSARALTNPLEERPFILEAFRRAGTGAFDIALEFMNQSVNHQIGLLASQRPGADILDRIRTALAAAPADLTAERRLNLERANRMLGAVTGEASRETPVFQPPQQQGQQGQLEPSDAGIEFIGGFEGFRADLYNDAANHCTVGFGHLVHRGPCNGTESAEFRAGITRERALELLRGDAGDATQAVRNLIRVALNQQQFDALVSFTFNLGRGALAGSTLLRELNAGHYDGVPAQMNRWVNAGGRQLPGLVRRRAAEGALFRDGNYGR